MSTPYHSQYYAHELTRRSASDDIAKLGPSLVSARVDLNPHQLDAALFAFRSPLSRGAILADEVGLGKTIEAGLIISQLWAEHKRRVLVIAPTTLRKQWAQELAEKFYLPSLVMDSREYHARVKAGECPPLAPAGQVLICSYHFARARAAEIQTGRWDLVVIDEAHRLRNVYKPGNKIANTIKGAVRGRPLLLLTATPLQNSLLELHGLVGFIDDDEHADLLYKLAGQMLDHLRSYLAGEDEVSNVVRYYEKKLAGLIHVQMQAHVWTGGASYEASDCRGYERIRPSHYSIAAGESVRNFREAVAEKLYIRGMLFGGFRRCLYERQKFDSDPERRFAVVLENEDEQEVLRWFKPGKGQLKIIDYKSGVPYEPDFVVETRSAKLLCEPKRASDMEDPEVLAKAGAAVTWCRWATKHEREHGGKPWMYLLIPDNAIDESGTLDGLIARFKRSGA